VAETSVPGLDCPYLIQKSGAVGIPKVLSTSTIHRWPVFLDEIGQLIPPERVYVIRGNHDHFQHHLDDEETPGEFCERAGTHFSQKMEVIIGGDRFLCCTLWTYFNIHSDIDSGAWDASQPPYNPVIPSVAQQWILPQ
jgi:hypothetical protein